MYKWPVIHLPTCEGGILREDIIGCWSEHNEDIDDAAFRDPTHVCLWCLTGALNIIQHFPKNRLRRDKAGVNDWDFVKDTVTMSLFNQTRNQKVKLKKMYLPSCVGADVHPGFSSIEPEDACGPLSVVG